MLLFRSFGKPYTGLGIGTNRPVYGFGGGVPEHGGLATEPLRAHPCALRWRRPWRQSFLREATVFGNAFAGASMRLPILWFSSDWVQRAPHGRPPGEKLSWSWHGREFGWGGVCGGNSAARDGRSVAHRDVLVAVPEQTPPRPNSSRSRPNRSKSPEPMSKPKKRADQKADPSDSKRELTAADAVLRRAPRRVPAQWRSSGPG